MPSVRNMALATLLLVGAIVTLSFVARLFIQPRWRFIVIHHTATTGGNMPHIRRYHRETRGLPDIAYHFLVNNGSQGTTAGQVEVSDLWKTQAANYSTKVQYLNEYGIAIALVGNFEKHRPRPEQLDALTQLVANLAQEFEIPMDKIVGHGDMWSTACPGRYLDMDDLRARVKNELQRRESKSGQ